VLACLDGWGHLLENYPPPLTGRYLCYSSRAGRAAEFAGVKRRRTKGRDTGFVWQETRRDDAAGDGRTGRTPRHPYALFVARHTTPAPGCHSTYSKTARAPMNAAAQKGHRGRHGRRHKWRWRRSRCEHERLSSSFGGWFDVR
jgi:hypothetical protein